jgi:hypothetical protein
VEVGNSNGCTTAEKASACESGGIARLEARSRERRWGEMQTSRSLRHVWVPWSLRHVDVAGAIVALHVVPQSQSCAAWCCGCSHFVACDVAVVVAGPGGRGGPRVRR